MASLSVAFSESEWRPSCRSLHAFACLLRFWNSVHKRVFDFILQLGTPQKRHAMVAIIAVVHASRHRFGSPIFVDCLWFGFRYVIFLEVSSSPPFQFSVSSLLPLFPLGLLVVVECIWRVSVLPRMALLYSFILLLLFIIVLIDCIRHGGWMDALLLPSWPDYVCDWHLFPFAERHSTSLSL